jgi:hypothetical protein
VQDYNALKAACKKAGTPFKDPEFNPDGAEDLIGQVELLGMKAQLPRWNGKFVWRRPQVRIAQVIKF